jgi:DNA-directed RNA polymerase specialized sigma24 family protein
MASTHTTNTPGDPNRQPARRRGDEERLYITHANRLRRIVAANVNTSGANVEDACSFAWLQLVAKDPRRETVFAWLAKVAIREAIRLDRRDRGIASIDDAPDHVRATRGADADVTERVLIAEVIDQLAGIHSRKRAMLVMHTAGFTSAEIAAAHGIHPSRARALIYQARLQLRARMGRAGVDPRSRK